MDNEYDQIVEKNYGSPQPANEYDSLVDNKYSPDESRFKQSQFVAKQINPDESAEAFKYSKKYNVPVPFAQKNLQVLKEKDDKTDMSYDAIIARSPRLAKWLEDPHKASVSRDDLNVLSGIERDAGRIKPYLDKPGLGEFVMHDLPSAFGTGFDNLEVSGAHLAAAYGLAPIEDVADYIAQKNKSIKEKQTKLPEYAKEFQAVMEKEGADVDREFNKLMNSFQQMRDGKILEGLSNFYMARDMTVAQVVDQIAQAVIRPRGTLRATMESAAFSLPAMITGFAGGKIGGVAGAAGGSVIPGLGTAAGGAIGSVGGFATGTFAGSAVTETGAWVNQALEERGVDITDPEQLIKAYKDPQLIAEVRAEGERKGVATAGIDALFSVIGGKIAMGAKAGKAAKFATNVGTEMVGEAASEIGGQVAAQKGDMSKVSIGEGIFEGIASMGQSVTTAATMGSYNKARQALPTKTTDAAVEVVENLMKAQEQLGEHQALEQLINTATDSKLRERSPEIFSEFVAEANIDGGAGQAVYFQKDQWDEMWRNIGESPVAKAEEFLATKSYDDANESGQPIAISLKDFVTLLGSKPEYAEILQIARTKPDGKTKSEIVETFQESPGVLKGLAEEAKKEKEVLDQQLKEEKEIKDKMVSQLKAIGRNPIEADLLMSFYKTIAQKEGMSVKDLADRFGLTIQSAQEAQAQHEKVYGQPEIPASERPAFYSKMAEIINKKVHGKAATVDQIRSIIKEAKADEIKWSGIEQFLEGKDKVSKDELMDFVEKSLLPIETVVLGSATESDKEAIERQINISEAEQIKSIDNRGTFDPSDPNIYKQESRGRIRFLPNNQSIIELFKSADKSTFLHESGHYFLEVMKTLALDQNASPELKDDFQKILDWLGVSDPNQIETEHHEKWARGFEVYLREGKAPSNTLRRAFNSFKVWLTEVYRRVTQLNVEINDEIRGVMDRMLATEDEINEAKGKLGDYPLLVDPVAEGMSPAMADKYRKATGEAEMRAKETHLKRLEKSIARRKKIEKGILKDQILKEIEDQPLYKAIDQLKSKEPMDGAPALKIDKRDFEEKFPEYKGSKKFRGMFSDEGLPIDVVASIVGFPSGQELAVAINKAPSKKELADFEAKRQVDERFKQEESPEALSEAADKALHNEPRARRLRMEMEFLYEKYKGLSKEIVRQVVKRPPSNAEMRTLAQRLIQNTPVGLIRPNQYRLAERRYAKEAGKALAANDVEAAFMAKQRELLNHYLYKEAQLAKSTVLKTEKLAKKFFQKNDKLAKTRDMDLISAGRAVLARYGLGYGDKEPLKHIANIKEYNPDAYETVSSIISGVMSEADNYEQVNYGNLVDLYQAAQALWDLSKDKKEVEVDGQKIQIAQATSEISQSLNIFRKEKPLKEYNETATKKDLRRVDRLNLKAALRRFENWVDVADMGNINGPMRKYVWTPVSEALDAYFAKKKELKKRLIELSKPLQNRPEFLKPIVASELQFEGKPFRFKNKYELIGALLHTGNQSNMKKLLIGYGWGTLDQDGNLVTASWDKFAQRMWDEGVLTKQDYDYVQSVWDLMEEIKPMAQKAHKKILGFYFDEITAHEIKTPFGTYKGGYAPAKVDPYAVSDLARRSELEEFVKAQPAYSWPAAGGKGFTISRVENFNKPLMLDISLVAQHIDESLRFAMVKPAVVDVAKIVTNQEFKTMIGEFDPKIISDMIIPALNRADKNKVYVDGAKIPKIISSIANGLRRNAALQLMFANVKNTAEQVAGFSVAATRIKPTYIAASSSRYFMNPKAATKFVREKSQFMATRTDEQMFEIDRQSQEIFRTETELLEKALRTAKDINEFGSRHAYFAQAFTQNIIDSIVWQASYDESVANGLDDKSAIRKADADIRLTQTSRRPVDVAGIETHQWLNFFNMFYSFFITMANLNADNFTKLYYEDLGLGKKSAKGLYMYMMGYAGIAVVSAAMGKLAAGGLDEDEDDEITDDLFSVFVGSQFELGFAMIPVVGSAAAAGYHEYMGSKPYLTKVGASPAASALGTVSRTLGKWGKGEMTDGNLKNSEIKDSLNALGIITGLPAGPAAKPIVYLRDVESGKAQPSGPLDYVRGLVTGKPGVK